MRLQQRRNRRTCLRLFLVVVSMVTASLISVQPAGATTRIVFARGSYCGSYSGNYRNGREFVLNLRADQRFTVTNTGAGLQTTWSISGPTGELEGSRSNRSTLEYYTEAGGDHFVYVTSTARRSAVLFCAY
jgi:hypothetical protein